MFYVVTESLKTDGGTANIDIYLDLTFDIPGGCPVQEVGAVRVTGRFVNTGGLIKFKGNFIAPYTDVCCRCLREVHREMRSELEAVFARSQSAETGDEEIYVYEGSKLTLGRAVEDAFLLALPYRDYCDGQDCRNDSGITQEV